MQNTLQTNKITQTIVTVTDNAYVEYLIVLLFSLKTNNPYSIEVFILNNGLTKENEVKLKLISETGFELYFINPSDFKSKISFLSKLKDPHFLRLLAPHILHDKKRILYLDADTMIRKNIIELFNNLDNEKTICAAVDYLENIETGISNWKDFGFNPDNKYFNSGVILINTDNFIKKRIAESTLDIIEKYSYYTKACGKWEQYDQYGLNVVLYNDWLAISNKYNYGSELEFKDIEIAHFNGHGKPTSSSCNAQFKREFYKYLHEYKKYETNL